MLEKAWLHSADKPRKGHKPAEIVDLKKRAFVFKTLRQGIAAAVSATFLTLPFNEARAEEHADLDELQRRLIDTLTDVYSGESKNNFLATFNNENGKEKLESVIQSVADQMLQMMQDHDVTQKQLFENAPAYEKEFLDGVHERLRVKETFGLVFSRYGGCTTS